MELCRPDWYCLGTQWNNPGCYLRFMRDERRLPRQLADLVGVPQCPEHHPEGCAFSHTCHVADAMIDICDRDGIKGDRRVTLFLAAVCHDMGKAVTTSIHPTRGRWWSPGHDVAGVPIAKKFLLSINFSGNIGEILALVRWHMTHIRPGFTLKAVKKLLLKLQPASLSDLILLMEADCRGRGTASSGLPRAVTDELIPIAAELSEAGVSTP